MRIKQNEKGVTLIEVIAGVVLIAIVLIFVFQFLTNAATFNAKNDVSIQSSTIAREYTVNVNDLYNGLTLDQLVSSHGFKKFNDATTNEAYYKRIDYKTPFIIETIIYEKRLPQSTYRSLRTAEISVWEDVVEGSPSSESYTYHEGEVINY